MKPFSYYNNQAWEKCVGIQLMKRIQMISKMQK